MLLIALGYATRKYIEGLLADDPGPRYPLGPRKFQLPRGSFLAIRAREAPFGGTLPE